MGKAQKEWARRTRDLLFFYLGKECKSCGSTTTLEFDCIIAQGDYHHRMDTSARMSFYRRQYFEGNLQVLCTKCNTKKSIKEKNDLFSQDNYPF